jgi:hypothetical protein
MGAKDPGEGDAFAAFRRIPLRYGAITHPRARARSGFARYQEPEDADEKTRYPEAGIAALAPKLNRHSGTSSLGNLAGTLRAH